MDLNPLTIPVSVFDGLVDCNGLEGRTDFLLKKSPDVALRMLPDKNLNIFNSNSMVWLTNLLFTTNSFNI
jgi:hypothetical protein